MLSCEQIENDLQQKIKQLMATLINSTVLTHACNTYLYLFLPQQYIHNTSYAS